MAADLPFGAGGVTRWHDTLVADSMAWFTRQKPSVEDTPADAEKSVRTEGLWQKCEKCSQPIWRKTLEENLFVCSNCGHHFRIDAVSRLRMLFDEGTYQEHDAGLVSNDPLGFVDSRRYHERLASMRQTTNLPDAIISATGLLNGRRVHICALELKFIGGSMGAVVGEKITRAIERCIAERIPLIIISASGGARMQEGAISLMQLAKISAALMKLDDARLPYISVMTDPTTGGVTASFAMLGDINVGEPGALIGFAGPRVIEQTIRQKLPEGFQRSEFLLEHGFLDAVVKRTELKNFLDRSIRFLAG
jgi:acetyl-CoA carboxylase carboxyl transferase subunit beta